MVKRRSAAPFAEFEKHLADQDRSRHTIGASLLDLRLFAQWFEQTNGERLTPQALTSTDAREYRQHLLKTQKAAPATINRKLAALRAYTAWARTAGLIETYPLNGIKPAEQQALAPKWLDKKEQAALVRAVEREVNTALTDTAKQQAIRDQAVVILLLNTGLRVSELCDLEIGDLTLSDRKGKPESASGKRREATRGAAQCPRFEGFAGVGEGS